MRPRSALALHLHSRKSNPKLLILLRLIHTRVFRGARPRAVNKTEQRSREENPTDTYIMYLDPELGQKRKRERESWKLYCAREVRERSKTTRSRESTRHDIRRSREPSSRASSPLFPLLVVSTTAAGRRSIVNPAARDAISICLYFLLNLIGRGNNGNDDVSPRYYTY